MSAAFAEIPVSVPGQPGLNFGDRFDDDVSRSEQVIKAAAGDWITAAIDDHRGFDKIHRRDAPLGGARWLGRPCVRKILLTEACALRRTIRRSSLVVLCDQIKRQLEDIRDFFQNCGCSLSPTTFQIGNVTLPDAGLVRDVELRLTAPFAKCA